MRAVALAFLVVGACAPTGAPPLVRAQPPVATTLLPAVPSPVTTSTAETPAPTIADAAALLTPSGVVVPVVGRDGRRVRVETPCGKEATLAAGTPIAGATVVLDPGHGGQEVGAVGANGLTEARLNLAVVGYARQALERAGVSVVLTRTGDYETSLATRAEIATKLRPRAFVSVHHNSSPDGPRDGPGTETYYQIGSASSKRLAGLLYEEIVRTLSVYRVGWVADRDAGAKYRQGEHGDYYAVLRRTAAVTSALAELAYLSNPPEADLLARVDVEHAEGDAVARAIVRYLTSSDAGSGFVEPYPRPPDPTVPAGQAPPCRDPSL